MKLTTKGLVRAASVPLLLASLGACASGFNADVSRFQTQLPAPQGQSFAIVADDPALTGGLEFSQYASFVAQEMQRLGYTQAASPESANLLVQFDYDISDGRERIRSYRDPFYSPWYGYSRFGYGYRSSFYRPRFGGWGYGFYDPWLGGGSDVRSYTIYNSGIELKIDNRATGQRLFEGRAEAVSTSNRLQYLVPNLVEAMFTDFPGRSGETVRITVRPEGDNRVRSVR